MTAAVFSPQARRDLLEAVRWITNDNPNAALALRNAVADAAEKLGEFSEMGLHRPELADLPVRFLVLRGFPYIVVYDAGEDPPLVLRVLHAARELPELLNDL